MLQLEPLIKVIFILRKEKKVGATVLVSEREFWYLLNFNPNNKPHPTPPLLLISILKEIGDSVIQSVVRQVILTLIYGVISILRNF